MNDDLCKEARERFYDANSELIMIQKRNPGMRPAITEIHNQPDSEIPIQKLDLEAIERWEKEVEKSQQKKDRALKEYDECKKGTEIEDA